MAEPLKNRLLLLSTPGTGFAAGTLDKPGPIFTVVADGVLQPEAARAKELARNHCGLLWADPLSWGLGFRMVFSLVPAAKLDVQWAAPGALSVRFLADATHSHLGVVIPAQLVSREHASFTVKPPRWPVLFAEVILGQTRPDNLSHLEISTIIPA
jgi:hypothetical protein